MELCPDWRKTGQMNSQNVAQRPVPVFGTGRECDPGAEWYAFAMLFGKSFETLDASILGPSDFVPKLTLWETSRRAF